MALAAHHHRTPMEPSPNVHPSLRRQTLSPRAGRRGWLARGWMVGLATQALAAAVSRGPAWHEFPQVLQPGTATEAFGPVWGTAQGDGERTWRFSPLVSHHEDAGTERSEYEVLYPVFTYDRFGTEYAARFLQFLEYTGSRTVDDESKDRRTLFPFFFYQKSTNPTNGYWGVLPFYGTVKNRLFRDEVHFVLAPLWVTSRKRDVQTKNLLLPFFSWRHGGGVRGWQAWPLAGVESREITHKKDADGDDVLVPGHSRTFVALPFFIHERTGLGTPDAMTNRFYFPFYTETRSAAMDHTSVLFFGHRTNRVEQFTEWSTPWPFAGWAHGPGKTARRVWPLFGQAQTPSLRSDFVLWPLYTHRGARGPSFERDRTRLLYFGYSDQRVANPDSGEEFRRRDLWPLFTQRRELNGQTRLQVLAPVEPLLPNNKSIERLYTPLWSLYRAESDPKTGCASQSLLWNVWRREVTPEARRTSLLFGLVHTETSGGVRRWHFLRRPTAPPTAPSATPATPKPVH